MANKSGSSSQSHGETVKLGDVIWVKDEDVLWWPAQVVDENNVSGGHKPSNTKSTGDVLVRLYGRYTYLYADPVKYRSDFKTIEEQTGGSFQEIFKKSLDLNSNRRKSGKAKGKSAGKSSVDKKSKGKATEQDGTPKKRKKPARKERVKRELALKAPKLSPFQKKGYISSSDESDDDE